MQAKLKSNRGRSNRGSNQGGATGDEQPGTETSIPNLASLVARDSSRELQFVVPSSNAYETSDVLLCPEFDFASQGDNLEEARANLIEPLTSFFETADASEIEQRSHCGLLVTQVEVPVG